MDFQYSDEHKMVEKMVYDFARKEIRPIIKDHDREHTFPIELIPKMANLGFLGICLPEKYACFGLTEPNAGSDVAGLQSTARKDGSDYILNGEKMWITLADVADRFLVFAKTDTDKGSRGITAFILERGWKGLTTGSIEGKMGVRASNTGWISMSDVRVPASHRLGEEGEGFKIAMGAIDNARYAVAAGAIGVIKACLEESIHYAKERHTFGKPIAQYQLMQQMIANMQQSLDMGQMLVWKAGWLKNKGMAR
ncbi:MAG: hypothetical protein B5M51_09350 [Anaerolinea sp. 4484_236]|nr:MAG: hypothetical protein B5M51_09350 [Anaerolinea sp. 4484_236]